jgi:hypothetical protein
MKLFSAIVGALGVALLALFRVEAPTRGDNCTISWRFVPATDLVPREE